MEVSECVGESCAEILKQKSWDTHMSVGCGTCELDLVSMVMLASVSIMRLEAQAWCGQRRVSVR
jgi:hypothetical protein